MAASGSVSDVTCASVPLRAIAGVTTGTARLIGGYRTAKAVDHMALAQRLTSDRMVILPGPVQTLLQLFGRFGMTAQSGLSHLGTTAERPLQRLELSVVRR